MTRQSLLVTNNVGQGLTASLLFRLSGSVGFAVDVDDGLLPQVDPVDELLVAVLLLDGLEALVEPLQGRLAGAEAGESGKLRMN